MPCQLPYFLSSLYVRAYGGVRRYFQQGLFLFCFKESSLFPMRLIKPMIIISMYRRVPVVGRMPYVQTFIPPRMYSQRYYNIRQWCLASLALTSFLIIFIYLLWYISCDLWLSSPSQGSRPITTSSWCTYTSKNTTPADNEKEPSRTRGQARRHAKTDY